MPYGGLDGRDALRENRLVESVTATLLYSDNGNQVTVAELNEGDMLLDVIITGVTTFNDSGTDTVVVGDKDDADEYVASVALPASGAAVVASQAGSPLVPHLIESAATPIYAVYTGQNSNATAGKAYVTAIIARCVTP